MYSVCKWANKAIQIIAERTVTSQESMLTLPRPTCINKGFILSQQSVLRHMKSLMLRAVRQSLEDPVPLISPHTCYVIPLIRS